MPAVTQRQSLKAGATLVDTSGACANPPTPDLTSIPTAVNEPQTSAAATVPTPQHSAQAQAGQSASLAKQWLETVQVLDGALRDIGPDTPWMQRLTMAHERSLRLFGRQPDAALYWHIHRAAHSTEHYSSSHAMLCMLVAREAALRLDWSAERVNSLSLAALTMNVSMRRLMDQLAAAELRVTAKVRADIESHAERSARVLAAAGVVDATQIQIVRLHHDDVHAAKPLAQLDSAPAAARLLRRVDIFTAKLSRRAGRFPTSPMRAAREACLGAGGVPDEIGAALLKVMGLYPPGSCVELHCGEIGIVIGRGRQANMPIVAALAGVGGAPLAEPAIRDTGDPEHGVKRAVGSDAIGIEPPHDALMAPR